MAEPLRRDYLSDEEYYLACIAELNARIEHLEEKVRELEQELEEDAEKAAAYEEVLRGRILEYNPNHWMEE
jgi:prefoldin subunit 5